MKSKKRESIQALRGLGFLAVFLYHAGIVPFGGGLGVSLFFILSGFLLMLKSMGIKEEGKRSLWLNLQYSIRRICKLYPLHVLMTFVALPFLIRAKTGISGTLLRIILNLTLFQAWFPQETIRYSMNNLSWFLSCMMFLYFVYPWLRAWLKKMNAKSYMLLALCTVLMMFVIGWIISRTVPVSDTERLLQGLTYNFPIYRLGDFVVGCCSGALFYMKCEMKENDTIEEKQWKYTLFEAIFLLLSLLMIIVDWNDVLRICEYQYLWQNPLLFMIPVIPLIWLFTENRGGYFETVMSLTVKKTWRLKRRTVSCT